MNKVEAGYELLVLLAISDDHFHHRERDNIKNFLEYHFTPNQVFKLEQPIYLYNINSEQKLQKLIVLADFFKSESVSTKMKMIDFSLSLILSDREVTKEEKVRFKIVGEYWDIDFEKLIEKKLQKRGV